MKKLLKSLFVSTVLMGWGLNAAEEGRLLDAESGPSPVISRNMEHPSDPLIRDVLSPELHNFIKKLQAKGKLSSDKFTWETNLLNKITRVFAEGAPQKDAIAWISDKIAKKLLISEGGSTFADKEAAYKNSINALRRILYQLRKTAVGDYLSISETFTYDFLSIDNGNVFLSPSYRIACFEKEGDVRLEKKRMRIPTRCLSMNEIQELSFQQAPNIFDEVFSAQELNCRFCKCVYCDGHTYDESFFTCDRAEALKVIFFDLSQFLAISLILWYHNDAGANLTDLIQFGHERIEKGAGSYKRMFFNFFKRFFSPQGKGL